MSDFMQRDILPELWNEMIKRHWNYFNTEESIQKLEERKKLEECLKEFLCMVKHDGKFFLSETAKVLKSSIRELEDFSAQKAITAFESISQYADNLFTKPWRKEFRVLKMYSGFYQHEIKSNLLNAEKLFEAMGYRRISHDTLILDGPICPDQVTNVSRDAMTAYVELQIIKHIYSSLDAIGIDCSWLDIYHYRERYTGGTLQAVKDLAYSIQEKRFRAREKALAGDNYGYIDVQPSSGYFPSNAQFCTAQCQCNGYQQPARPHRPMQQTNGTCCLVHDQPQSLRATPNIMYNNMAYPTQHNYSNHHHHLSGISAESGSGGGHSPHISHTRSLEHYSEPANHRHSMVPHRYSFDNQQQGCITQHQHRHSHQQPHLQQQQQQQQQHYYQSINQPQQNFYESPYDCIDGNSLGGGSSTISYAAPTGINSNFNMNYSHPYNVSGNRVPLPLNISNQLSAYDNIPSSKSIGSQEPTYAHITDQHTYASVAKLPQNCMANTTNTAGIGGSGYNKLQHVHGIQNSTISKDSLQRQRSEQLINLEDPSIMPPPQQPPHLFDSLNHYQTNYGPSNHTTLDKRYMEYVMENPRPPPPTTACLQSYVTNKLATNGGGEEFGYAKPTPKENRQPQQNPTATGLRKSSFNNGERSSETTDLSYESTNEDFINLTRQQDERNHQRSPTQLTKNQDGVGSFEAWDYVYQNLNKSGYSKDLGGRDDLLVHSLDLDSLNINNDTSPSQTSSAEKRRSNYAGNENKTTSQQQYQTPQQQTQVKQKSRTFEKSTHVPKTNTKMEASASSSVSTSNNCNKQKNSMDNNKKIKSALKQTNATSNANTTTNNTNPKINDNKPKTMNNNNNNNSLTNVGNGTTQRKKPTSSIVNVTRKSSAGSSNALPITTTVTSPKEEWHCPFCTFLNLNAERICEMCSRTKDCNLDSSETSLAAASGGTSVAHNTPTCV